ncbi:hypothetical protein TorRG33x02_285320 [Trema orientale]|uniref:Uncharacterized protein n=1 Tax=Trema orientale TaxID=63057 RepID=A0A2P5CGQ0_TREOI|nr:hypothetical protein TorRG33x02_285320 [Trema orientale]
MSQISQLRRLTSQRSLKIQRNPPRSQILQNHHHHALHHHALHPQNKSPASASASASASAPCVAGYLWLTRPLSVTCCPECYGGHGGGPCNYDHGDPPGPPHLINTMVIMEGLSMTVTYGGVRVMQGLN